MSDRMSLDHARAIAEGYGASTVNEQRAAKTIVQVGKVADLLYQMADDNHALSLSGDWIEDRAEGLEHAYAKASTFIREALGDLDE